MQRDRMRNEALPDESLEETLDDRELDAVAAGCALLGSVDGANAEGIRERLNAVLKSTGLPDTRLSDTEASFDRHVERIRQDQDIGEDEALAALRAMKGDAGLAKKTIGICHRIAEDAGELAPAQSAMARRLCESLNLSPTQLSL